jgi:uncharacterized protein (UPF0261 family)
MPGVLLVTSLDTRPDEAAYLKALLKGMGCVVTVVDISMREHTQSGADYTCADVAREGGVAFGEISSHKGTADIIEPMLKGCAKIAERLHGNRSIDVICGFGGGSNTLFLSSVMRTLPFGFPKLILSSSAAIPAYAGAYYGFKDIAIFHSCVDINGLNRFVKDVLRRFAGMVAGSTGVERLEQADERRQIALTEFQFSETCARRVRDRCVEDGLEPIPFHAQGVGDRIMEEMVADGLFSAIVDLVPAGLSEAVLGGNRAGGLDRLDAELGQGIPVILTPCGFDMLSCGPLKRAGTDPFWKKKRLSDRKLYIQDELRVQARTSKQEMEVIGSLLAEKLNRAKGPTYFYIPLKGFSSLSVAGGPLFDPEADRAFVRSLKRHLNGRAGCRIELIDMDCSMEDAIFADSIAERVCTMTGTGV